MPNKFNISDGTSSFMLGRRAFSEKTYKNYINNNLQKNLANNTSDLRTQRLRLLNIGKGSTSLKNENDNITFGKEDKNFVNNALSRVRGGGSVAPKKGK